MIERRATSALPRVDGSAAFLRGGGEAAQLIAAFDWTATPLGPLAAWPAGLKTTVGLLLRSPVPIVLLWGEAGTMIYNDAYSLFGGARHPALLGRAVREAWPEVADFNDNVMEVGLAGGTLAYRDQELTLYRNGEAEQVWMNLDYSPVPDEHGTPAGVMAIVVETTARVRADALSRESEARFRNMAEHVPAMVWVTGADGECTYVNQRWYDYTGQSPEQSLGLGWLDATHPDDRVAAEAAFRAANAGQGAFRIEYRLRARDGSFRWMIDAASPRHADDGSFLGYIGSVVDIDDRRAMEEALRASEERLRDLNADLERKVVERTHQLGRTWQNNPDILGVVNADGFFERSNPAWQAALGLSEDEIASKPYAEMMHPDDREATAAAFAEFGRGAPLIRFENRYHRRGDGYRWLSWVCVADDGKFYCTARDITDEKAAADALDRSQRLLRAIIETSFEYQGLLGVDGTLIDANATSLRSVGVGLEVVAGKKFWETPWFAATPTVARLIEDAVARVAAGETFRTEFTVSLPIGWRRFDFAMRPIRDEAGTVVALVPEAIDITERRAAEDALRQSQKLEAMGQLTGGVAHDFNNLLTPIIGSLDMLERRGIGSERERRLIAGALQSADRAKVLVQRLLAFARRQPLQPVPVDIARLVDGMAGLVASTTGPRIDVRVIVAGDLPAAIADPNQLEMAILNLSVNARDAMPDGGALEISAATAAIIPGHRSALPPGDYIRLAVADTGFGMDEATLARAIEPFFSTKGVGRGTGLGLSMVHGLAAQLSGALTIASTPGHGSTVELWLPVSATPAAAGDDCRSAHVPKIIGTALLVDDEDLVRTSTAEMLAELGFAVIEAASAEEALRAIDGGLAPDVLITDHVMPGMTGVELAHAVRARRPDTAVLIVSGFAEVEGLDPDLPRLTKPFRQTELAARVSSVTGGTKA